MPLASPVWSPGLRLFPLPLAPFTRGHPSGPGSPDPPLGFRHTPSCLRMCVSVPRRIGAAHQLSKARSLVHSAISRGVVDVEPVGAIQTLPMSSARWPRLAIHPRSRRLKTIVAHASLRLRLRPPEPCGSMYRWASGDGHSPGRLRRVREEKRETLEFILFKH
jgi:hypothetical protein